MYRNKVIVITASSTGIGFAIAQKLASQGATIIISSRNLQHVQQAVKKLQNKNYQVVGIVCHVSKAQDRQKLIKFTIDKFSKIDILICNAAVSTHFGNTIQIGKQQIQKMWEVNFFSVFYLIQIAYPHLIKNQGSNILIISSYAAFELPVYLGHYSLTKIALVALSKLLSKQLPSIRVNCIAPGLIKTKFSSMLWKQKQQIVKNNMKVNRLGQVEDIAQAANFICSQKASYITGQTLFVAGKSSSRL